jgi:hypothetical protein
MVHCASLSKKLKNVEIGVACVVDVEIAQSLVLTESYEEFLLKIIVNLCVLEDKSFQRA